MDRLALVNSIDRLASPVDPVTGLRTLRPEDVPVDQAIPVRAFLALRGCLPEDGQYRFAPDDLYRDPGPVQRN